RHLIGPLQVRRREPFGMVEMRQEVSGDVTLLALPPVTPLLPLRAGGGFHSSGDDSPRSFSVGKVADVVVREYRRGDDLRRVHWRSTARMGELMVRNEEQTWQARSVVLLDNRASAHRGSGPGSSLEAAVGAAASVAVHLSSQGFEVRLVTASGTVDAWRERGRSLDPFPILEHLATLDLVDTEHLPEVSVGDEQLGAVAVGVLGSTSTDDARWWGRFPQHGAQCVALVLDVDAWGQRGTDPADGSPVPTWLTGQGWRAAGLTQGASLAATWRELDR
ncbi:MAG: hypothetical protein JWO46_2811, partial [Nocardioidaceae bacterium]|nr:hypothetical protein [Nocardioidaceae bacterium]